MNDAPTIGDPAADLVRRLRKFGERFPAEEATADLCREAADAIERLRAEAVRLAGERDAITRLLVVESLAKGTGWLVQEDLPPRVKGFHPTFESAVRTIRRAAGLDPEEQPCKS